MPYNFWEIVLPIQSPFLGRLSFEPLKENPLFGPSSNTLEKLGALKWDKVVHGNQAWRLITCIWLHAGVIHLLANMLSLIFIGIRLEQEFGFTYYRLFSFNVAFLLVPLVHLPAGARVTSKHKAYQYLFLVIAMVLLIVGFTVGLVMLFRGENGHDHCSWCHYLSCVPTSKWHCGN
ncbi:hypothetical protein ES332_D13G137100v1 [Gossypium tomentosum]|uniref:RHOMBOID-like protein n=1 Tax=Gossypium tomentosum TaxID=34277 RepID=A0A5D2HWR5_GOSTO|nr:hypothetical protein ES332_D13G137100v1 [Gossypium tomentosum]